MADFCIFVYVDAALFDCRHAKCIYLCTRKRNVAFLVALCSVWKSKYIV